ncbi:SH3 domain-binding protein 5-like [Stigmatopora argus]
MDPRRCDDETDYEDEEVDPRIQGELERLNQSSDDINQCEMALEEARQKFRSVLVDATVKLDELLDRIGKPVDESKPYWEARRVARQAQLEAQKATQEFHRASEVLRAAKETISLAEQRLLEEDRRHFDSAWQEMLNHATQRVAEAEQEKARSEAAHKETAAKHAAAIGRMKQLEKKLKRPIAKSKPYFEMKAKFYFQLENLKTTVDERQARLWRAKGQYRAALGNLESISDEIHRRRSGSVAGLREPGVGWDGDSTTSTCSDDGPAASGEDSETRSTCSWDSAADGPREPAHPSPRRSPSPRSPDLPEAIGPPWDLGLVSPVLGPRSECSGASSPDCDAQRGDRAEGAEMPTDGGPTPAAAAKLGNDDNDPRGAKRRSFNLEAGFSFLNLRRQRQRGEVKSAEH